MTCEQTVALLSDYLDGQTDPADAAAVERHLATCAACAHEYADLRRTVELCRSVGEVEMPEGFHQDLMNKIEAKQSGRRGLMSRIGYDRLGQPYRGMAAVAAVLVLAFCMTTVAEWAQRPGITGSSRGAMPQLAAKYGQQGSVSWDEAEMENSIAAAPAAPAPGASPDAGGFVPGEPAAESPAASGLRSMAKKMAPVPESAARMQDMASLAVPPVTDGGYYDGVTGVTEKKLIKRADLMLETPKDQIDETGRKVVSVTEMSKGFVQRSSTFMDEGKYKGLSFVLRIPEERFASVLGELESMGKVLSRSIESEDVTEQYIDTQAQIKNKERQEQRLNEIMGKANTVGELMQVENELNRVRAEVDSLKGRLKYLQGATSYSTITLTIREPRDGTAGPVLPGFWDDIWRAFVSTFKIMAMSLARIAPYALIIWAGWLIYVKSTKGKKSAG